MRITDKQMSLLVEECDKLIADPEYRSPRLYVIIDFLIKELFHVKRMRKYPKPILEECELNAILCAYKKIPRFNLEKATKAREERGLPFDYNRSIYQYVDVILSTSFLTTLSNINKKKMNTISIDTIGLQEEDGFRKNGRELAYIETEDVDARIDEERAQLRRRIECKRI